MPEAFDTAEFTSWLKRQVWQVGFAQAAATPAVRPLGADRLREWIETGYGGQMQYIADRFDAYGDPGKVLDGAVSILMLTLDYQTAQPTDPKPGQGRVSRYAWSDRDYHDTIHARLKKVIKAVRRAHPSMSIRGVVDSAPLLERDFAQQAGLGWIGKHTLLLNRSYGSYFFLAALLLDVPLEYDNDVATNHCGTCTACLDACPTDAFPQPGVLDATRCISYLTIELDGPIPNALRQGMGDWVFGCDVCQDVCPWNRRASHSITGEFDPCEGQNPLNLVSLFNLDEDGFRARFRRTPLWRAKRRGLLRNAAIALGNQPSSEGLAALKKGLSDEEPLVRGACAWALGRYPNTEQVLATKLVSEQDEGVRLEIRQSLGVDDTSGSA